VIGAGLAGLSSASYLLERNFRPVVVEALSFVGGRTASWTERGMTIETGLHRFLGFYTHLPELLQKAGVELDDMLFWEDEIEIRMPDGPSAVFGLAPANKPAQTLRGMIGNNDFLTFQDKLSLGRFFLRGRRDYVHHPEYLDSVTVLEYAKKHSVTKNGIERLLIPLTEGIFFLPIAEYSAYVLFGLIVPYGKSIFRLRVGAFRGGMTKVMAGPIARHIRAKGGEIILGQPVKRIHKAGETFTVTTAKRKYEADAVVLAASLRPAQEIIRNSFKGGSFNPMLKLLTMPSVTFQIELSEPSMEQDRTTFGPLTCMASFTEQSRTTFRGSKGRLSIILTPPEKFIDMKPADIMQQVMLDAKRLGINLEGKVLDYRKVVIPHDFYKLSPRMEVLRPRHKTSLPGFFLAGDYTRQKYMATMEGAVFSGKRAARLVDDYLGGGLL
jgi:15-cis-phytoene desaturase